MKNWIAYAASVFVISACGTAGSYRNFIGSGQGENKRNDKKTQTETENNTATSELNLAKQRRPVPTVTPYATPTPMPTVTVTPAPSPLPTPSTGGTPDISGWTVAWADEFNGDTLDVNLWGKYLGPSPRNNEKNYYTADDVYLSNGKLVIRQQKRVYGSGTDQRQYTSGQVISKKLIGGRPTRVDIRVKAPRGQGLHSGYWAYPNASNTWPPEIDFLEVIGSQPTTGNYTWHYGSDWTSHKSIGNWFPGPDFTTSFNDITVEYDSTKIVWYLNGQERFRVTSNLAQVLNSMNVLLDTSIGGDWPGLPDSTTVFPSYNEIDYFRVYVK